MAYNIFSPVIMVKVMERVKKNEYQHDYPFKSNHFVSMKTSTDISVIMLKVRILKKII